jgi:nucleoside-diphosphate-sugar epimerase
VTVDLLVLGCGFSGSAIARRARDLGRTVLVTVRSPERASLLEREGFTVCRAPALDGSIAEHVAPTTHVVVAFPPDGTTDASIAPALESARAITYVSSTGVYGERTGAIDDATSLPTQASPRAARILEAEQHYRALGATILRCPGIYGPTRGLHVRILRGEHRIPGDGSRTLSRIHVEDLASFALASEHARGETFVVGDLAPAPHLEVVRYVCEAYGVPLPPSVPWDEVHETLRADRAVDATRALRVLGVTLRFPSYREGMAPGATGLRARAAD